GMSMATIGVLLMNADAKAVHVMMRATAIQRRCGEPKMMRVTMSPVPDSVIPAATGKSAAMASNAGLAKPANAVCTSITRVSTRQAAAQIMGTSVVVQFSVRAATTPLTASAVSHARHVMDAFQ